MKGFILTAAVILGLAAAQRTMSDGGVTSATTEQTATPQPDTIEVMVYTFAVVESRCNDSAYNEKEDAVGILQIRPIMVREANRIAGEEVYTLDDRWDAEVSADIFRTIMQRHNTTLDIDRAIDIWNPRCPDTYRQRVKKEYEKAWNR